MNESLLHYFWKNKIFSTLNLQTIDNHSLTLVHAGFPHQDAGPDFKQAIIKIDGFTWVGDVEIHVRTSDWLKHKHQFDEKYQSIILHVVYEHDRDIESHCPTLELKNYISEHLIEEYQKLSLSSELLPCKSALNDLTSLQLTSWLSRVATERLLRKQKELFDMLDQCHGDWHETAFRLLLKNFGFRTNAPAFDMLAQNLPYKYIVKHRDSQLQIYALFFGQAGMLDEEYADDDYYLSLQSEYQYLKYKYKLQPIPVKLWNLLRLRPQNFPCVRIAQLCQIIFELPELIPNILKEDSEICYFPSHITPHVYWETHRHFGKKCNRYSCVIGKQTIDLLLINTIVPAKFAYSTFMGNEVMKEQALGLLETIDFEINSITRTYAAAGFPKDNALCSQALMELNKQYCTSKRCLDCDIGCHILKRC